MVLDSDATVADPYLEVARQVEPLPPQLERHRVQLAAAHLEGGERA